MKQLIYFHSKSCKSCIEYTPLIDKLKQKIPIVYIDTGVSPHSTYRWNIKVVPTILLIENTMEIGRLVGIKNENEIKSLYNR